MTKEAEQKKDENDDIKLDLEPMEGENQEEIVVKTDEPEEKKAEEPEKPAEKEIPVDAGIQELKRKLEEEANLRKAAESRTAEAETARKAAVDEAADSNIRLIETAIQKSDSDIIMIKQRLRAAMAENDVDGIVEAQSDLTKVISRKETLEQGKTAYEAKIKEAKAAPVIADPVEALAQRVTPRSADWVRKHPEFARDRRLFDKMIAAHQMTVADGISADTDEYFENIETLLKLRKPPAPKQDAGEDDALSEAAEPAQRRSSPPAAPVSRSAVTNSGTKSNVVRLTAAERDIASMMGMTDKEYATQKVQLIKEGKLK